VYESNGRRYFVLHGDVFDRVTSSMSWLSKLGDVGYSILLWMNNIYNRRRILKGLPYYSFAQEIKKKVKASVSHISNFERHVVDIARAKNCDGVICGHIHHPEIRMYEDILYLNSGDWIESLSALTEDHDGNWRIFRQQTEDGGEKDGSSSGGGEKEKKKEKKNKKTMIND
jgi:UDP-2,3-diacylglucosamine pyrophosphatase LpxH